MPAFWNSLDFRCLDKRSTCTSFAMSKAVINLFATYFG